MRVLPSKYISSYDEEANTAARGKGCFDEACGEATNARESVCCARAECNTHGEDVMYKCGKNAARLRLVEYKLLSTQERIRF